LSSFDVFDEFLVLPGPLRLPTKTCPPDLNIPHIVFALGVFVPPANPMLLFSPCGPLWSSAVSPLSRRLSSYLATRLNDMISSLLRYFGEIVASLRPFIRIFFAPPPPSPRPPCTTCSFLRKPALASIQRLPGDFFPYPSQRLPVPQLSAGYEGSVFSLHKLFDPKISPLLTIKTRSNSSVMPFPYRARPAATSQSALPLGSLQYLPQLSGGMLPL